MMRPLDAARRTAFGSTVLAMAVVSCAWSTSEGTCPGKPKALVVVGEARTTECGPTADDGYELVYEVREPYPAEKTLSSIQETLSHLAWAALDEDLLNPGVSSSHVDGWASFEDATITPASRVRQWYAQWRNKAGDVVAYGLLYTSPLGDKATPDTVEVSARYLKCEIVVEGLTKLAPESPYITECGSATAP